MCRDEAPLITKPKTTRQIPKFHGFVNIGVISQRRTSVRGGESERVVRSALQPSGGSHFVEPPNLIVPWIICHDLKEEETVHN
jgi:hypothetical protein